MSFSRMSLRSCGSICMSLFVLVCLLALAPATQAQLPDLVVQVSDTTADAGEQNTVISIFMSNYVDTVAGFNLFLQLDRPDIMEFQADTQQVTDTIYECTQYNQDSTQCLDSAISEINTYDALVGNFDTTGTLISGWELVDARSPSGGFDLNIVGLADDPFNSITTPGIAPQTDGLLIKILADVFNVDDTLQDRTANILIQHDFLDLFNFSRPDGTSIGIIHEEVEDTSYHRCTQWAGSTCLQYQEVSLPPYDSTSIDTILAPTLDTTDVILVDGALKVNPPYVCGNINGSDPPTIDISDLTYLVIYMFKNGPEPAPLEAANVNCSGGTDIDISDLVYMVTFMFKNGSAPCAACP